MDLISALAEIKFIILAVVYICSHMIVINTTPVY